MTRIYRVEALIDGKFVSMVRTTDRIEAYDALMRIRGLYFARIV